MIQVPCIVLRRGQSRKQHTTWDWLTYDCIGPLDNCLPSFWTKSIQRTMSINVGLALRLCRHEYIFTLFSIIFISFSYRCHVEESFSLKTISLHFQMFPLWRPFSKFIIFSENVCFWSFSCRCKVKTQKRVTMRFGWKRCENVFVYTGPKIQIDSMDH